jgi:hypothetical protein
MQPGAVDPLLLADAADRDGELQNVYDVSEGTDHAGAGDGVPFDDYTDPAPATTFGI